MIIVLSAFFRLSVCSSSFSRDDAQCVGEFRTTFRTIPRALVTLACELTSAFPGQLVFKGGFVLRHAFGHVRFNSDVDATRHDPARVMFDADMVAAAIRNASIHNVITFTPRVPATASTQSLDFDDVVVSGKSFANTSVQVEVRYR